MKMKIDEDQTLSGNNSTLSIETVLLSDIIDFIAQTEKATNLIIKIDIEAYECKAFLGKFCLRYRISYYLHGHIFLRFTIQ